MGQLGSYDVLILIGGPIRKFWPTDSDWWADHKVMTYWFWLVGQSESYDLLILIGGPIRKLWPTDSD